MRTLEELTNHDDPAIPLVRQWLAESSRPVELLPPSERNGEVLVNLQVTTRSPMGAIAYETGGILVDKGWLRILGSGHPRLPRDIAEWNAGRSSGYLLVADDVAGGFFAVNGGNLGDDPGSVYYWAPDTLKWESLGLGYTDFFCWALSDRLTAFYEGLRWSNWEADMQKVDGGQCFSFYPPLWTAEGTAESSSRKPVSVADLYALSIEGFGQAQ
ncbi:DUF2625 domain-containing protein [Polaromonas sp. LjRoot131]|uniref:DUF2625 domain-containing protein n=1 Tax=Polaromonas sp. LjRoot131 TaxID=3342262 RepID=UPI003ECC648C